jgi:hypothetical protein
MAIAGHVSRHMLERYSHVRMEAKRSAMETLAVSTRMAGCDTSHDTNCVAPNFRPVKLIEKIGGPGRDRSDDLFHAMEQRKSQLADGKGFNSRRSRQNATKTRATNLLPNWIWAEG